jgi:hypothetical protein
VHSKSRDTTYIIDDGAQIVHIPAPAGTNPAATALSRRPIEAIAPLAIYFYGVLDQTRPTGLL